MEKSKIHANRYGKGEKRCWQKTACLMIPSQVDVRTRANLDLKSDRLGLQIPPVQTQNAELMNPKCVSKKKGVIFLIVNV